MANWDFAGPFESGLKQGIGIRMAKQKREDEQKQTDIENQLAHDKLTLSRDEFAFQKAQAGNDPSIAAKMALARDQSQIDYTKSLTKQANANADALNKYGKFNTAPANVNRAKEIAFTIDGLDKKEAAGKHWFGKDTPLSEEESTLRESLKKEQAAILTQNKMGTPAPQSPTPSPTLHGQPWSRAASLERLRARGIGNAP